MSAPTALIIGGNGTISAASTRLAVQMGFDVTLLNRGRSSTRPPIEGVQSVIADSSDSTSLRSAMADREFDVVVDFQTFLPGEARDKIEIFEGHTGHYVFISSAAGYLKPVARLPIVESSPMRNPYWQYARDKIASEFVFTEAFRERLFPVTIVRPSHTYDHTLIPLDGGWTTLERMKQGREVVIHGDGTSLWTLTHHTDFAKAFVPIWGNPRTFGDVFQITSDETLTWNQIAGLFGDALGVTPNLVHLPAEQIADAIPEWAPGLLGDKMHSVVFDNSKIKSLVPDYSATVPFWRGAREIVNWYEEEPSRRAVNVDLDARLDRLISAR